MANPETTTPSVEGDRLEAIARLVDPIVFAEVDRFMAYAKTKGWSGWDTFGIFLWSNTGLRLSGALHRARQIAALATPTTEPDTGRGLREVVTRAVVESAHLSHEALHRTVDAVLAALSDTPSGRLEASRAQEQPPASGPGAVAPATFGQVKP